jgi:SLOG family YspA-like protein
MRILITGSRTWTDADTIASALDDHVFGGTDREITVVHGACPRGADRIAAEYCELLADAAERRGVTLVVEPHPAEWQTHGRRAGFIRNREMVAAGADCCLAFIARCADPACRRISGPHGSHGAVHCSAAAEAAGIAVRTWWQ